MLYCVCGLPYPDNALMPIRCGCGEVIGDVIALSTSPPPPACQTRIRPLSKPVNWNAAICRLNLCGRYDRDHDACLEVIKRGVTKGEVRTGKVNWLHSHPNQPCVAPDPLFRGDETDKERHRKLVFTQGHPDDA